MFQIESHKIEEILRKKIRKIGNSCHVLVPKKHEGKTAVIVIVDERFFK